MSRADTWYRAEVRVGGEPIASVIVSGYRAAQEEASRLRRQYPTASVKIARDAS